MGEGWVLKLAEASWIEPLVHELQRPSFQLAVLLVRDYDLAQEIVQEAFVRVWLSPRTPRVLAAFRPWLYRTIVNLARDHQRRQGRWARLRFGRPESADPLELAERRHADAELADAVRGLSRREQEAIYVRFFEDAPYDEVARIIGGRSGAARVLVHRALRKLRRQLDPGGGDEVIGA
jgi:RNA polymerase sigma-70 factor, ECF subfamily